MDILQYKRQLEEKLATVNAIIAEMGGTTVTAKRRGRPPGAAKAKAAVAAVEAPGKKGKRKMSAAGRARIAAAARARWAAAKKAGKTKLG